MNLRAVAISLLMPLASLCIRKLAQPEHSVILSEAYPGMVLSVNELTLFALLHLVAAQLKVPVDR